MSGIVAVIELAAPSLADSDLARMIAALDRRGDRSDVWRGNGATLAVTRFDWEMVEGFAGPALIARDEQTIIVADASLYYRDDLVRKLRDVGVTPAGDSVGHLIGAAYRAWGTECTTHLEGDYSFIVYDRARRRTFAARDFMGRRPLYHAHVGGSLIIASTVGAIIEHSSCPRDLDHVALAEIIAVSLAGHDRTPYSAIKALPAASSLMCDAAGKLQVREYWRLPAETDATTQSCNAAVEELKTLLESAVAERCAPAGSTAIWLSGGYDSPVVYGIGNTALGRRGLDRLQPVSVSYPPGDSGREDELIEEILGFWNAKSKWLSIEDVPLLANAADHAAGGDIPFQHAFENWLRALLGATREQGSRVALYGDGGDQLFAVSTVFLRDLLTGLRWRELGREWRAFGGGGLGALWSEIIRPALSDMRGSLRSERRPAHWFPPWLRADFLRSGQLEIRQLRAEASLADGGGGHAGAETRRSLTNPVIPRVLAGLSAMALEHSVELRTPLLDRRVVDFALSRPRRERASGGAVKHLLRQTASGLLPASVLAPRPAKTGVLTDYFARGFRADPAGLVSDTFEAPVLADLGIVDAVSLQQAWLAYQKTGSGSGGHLYVAFQTELWLKSRTGLEIPKIEVHSARLRSPAAGNVQ